MWATELGDSGSESNVADVSDDNLDVHDDDLDRTPRLQPFFTQNYKSYELFEDALHLLERETF